MESDFKTARLALTEALANLQGSDPFSARTREALDLLIEAIAQKEFSAPENGTNVLRFCNRRKSSKPTRR